MIDQLLILVLLLWWFERQRAAAQMPETRLRLKLFRMNQADSSLRISAMPPRRQAETHPDCGEVTAALFLLFDTLSRPRVFW